MTLRMKGNESTNEPPCLHMYYIAHLHVRHKVQ